MSAKGPTSISTAFAFSYVERALWEGLGRRRFGEAERAEILRFFGLKAPRCVYCGASRPSRWDHLVAVRCGGETVIGNMVPACGSCDDSKAARNFDDWMVSSARLSPFTKRVPDVEVRRQRIREYAAQYGYKKRALGDGLLDEERAELEQIQAAVVALKSRIDRFLASYRSRQKGHEPS